jgi:hypothetical protein
LSQEIKVYLEPNKQKVCEKVFKQHGFNLPEGAFGYPAVDAANLYVVGDNKVAVNLTHELFHLAARRAVPDIPLWLDEGMARLFADSEIEGKRIISLKDWGRAEYLRNNWLVRPYLANLATTRWNALEEYQSEKNPPDQVKFATAYYFVKYLHEKGKLKKIIEKLRKRKPKHYTSSPEADVIKVMQEVFGKSLEEIDAEFAVSFRMAPCASK